MGTRHLSLLEQKKMQWAKEREEMAGLCAPWGPPERTRPLRKRLVPNLPEEPDEDLQSRAYENLTVPSAKGSPIEDPSLSLSNTSTDNRGRPAQRERNEVDSRSPSLPPVNHNIQEDPRQRSYYRGKEGSATRPEGFEGYLYFNDPHGLSKSAENFIPSESDLRAKRKAFLSGDRLGGSGSLEKISADHSPYSSSYQFRNSNLSIATEGDNTWREWGNARGGSGDELRPRWGDRGINVGPPWNPGGQTPMGRPGDNLGPVENYPTPGWVERGLSRMSGDGRGRGGSAEYQRGDPGIRVYVSDEMGGTQRLRGSTNELQNLGYGPGDGIIETSPQRNYEGRLVGIPYAGEMPSTHSSAGTPHRTGSVTEGNRGERVIVVGRDVYNASEIVNNGRPYGYGGCISAPSNKSSGYKFKTNDDVTSSLPNLQCSNTHLRGQNVPVDPDVIVEREMRRLKAMELQKAIRQQLDEREKRRIQEKEQRLKEERDLEDRSKKQQELERMKKEEEERKHREKKELENKKAEIMREALEAAEQDAQKQRKKRSLRQNEERNHKTELNQTHPDSANISKTDEQIGNYIISSCCPVITEDGPSIHSQPVQPVLENVDYIAPPNFHMESNVASRSRAPSVYEGTTTYHSSNTPLAPFKITLPETSMSSSHEEGGESIDHKQGGVLIVGRDVYLLPYVNTEVLAPKLMNGSTYSLGAVEGFDNIGNRIYRDDQYDYRREWVGNTTRLRASKDVATQTDPCSQGPLLLLLRMSGPEDAQNGYEQRSSTDDSSVHESECKEAKGKAFSADAATSNSDCCFCHMTRSQSQPSCSKASGPDIQQKHQQVTDCRPKWGANRPSRKYTTQSEKDLHYSCRTKGQKRPSQVRNKRDAAEIAATEEGSEEFEQPSKSQMKSKPKIELPPSIPNPSCSNGTSRTPTPRNKGKKSEKISDSQKSDQHLNIQVSQSSLPVLVPPRKEAPRRVQIVKPSLSLDQDLNGHIEQQYSDCLANRAQLTFFPTSQLSPLSVPSEIKHLLPPVLPVLQQGRLSPIRITQSPISPIRISPSPSSSVRLCPTPMPPIRASQSPVPSLRQTPVPSPPTPTYQTPLSSRQCGSPPVPAVLAKMRREQAKSPPRQFSFISAAPDKEDKVTHPRKETRSSTPSVKQQTPRPVTSTPRAESSSTVLFISPREEPSGPLPKIPSCPPSPDLENKSATSLVTPRDDISVCSPSLNVSCPSASTPGGDASNALMLVTLSEDISIGSPSPNPLSSIVEVDDKGSFMLVTPSEEISVGLDSRSNLSVSRASQISAEEIPDGFWEDYVPPVHLVTPRPKARSAISIVEECFDEQKADEIKSDSPKQKADQKAEEINFDGLGLKDDHRAEEIEAEIHGLEHDQKAEEISPDEVRPKDDQRDELEAESHKSKNDQVTGEISFNGYGSKNNHTPEEKINESHGFKNDQKSEKISSDGLEAKDDQKAEEIEAGCHESEDDHEVERISSDDLNTKDNQRAEGCGSDSLALKDDLETKENNSDSQVSQEDKKVEEKKFDSYMSKDTHGVEEKNSGLGSTNSPLEKGTNFGDLGVVKENTAKITSGEENEVPTMIGSNGEELSQDDVKTHSKSTAEQKESESTLEEEIKDNGATEIFMENSKNCENKDRAESH